MPLHTYTWKSPIGELILASHNEKLVMADWKYRKKRTEIDHRISTHFQTDFITKLTPVIENTITQLEEYFNTNRTQFDIPLELAGTPFQKNVWHHLTQIPYGKTNTYLALSQKIGNEKAIRAVASANGANAISIIIPCHRIIGSNGELIGYAGGLNAKKKLLNIESKITENTLFK